MADFTGGAIHALPNRPRSSTGNPDIDARIKQLIEDWGCGKSGELIQEMVVTALKMGHDNLGVADLKLFSRSLKELRYAARVFAPYAQYKKVVVFGSARISQDNPACIAAETFARKMQTHDFMTITGGGEGIMGAAQRGAGRAHSFGLNIRLPFEQHANETIDGDPKLINFNYFFTRKLNFLKETHAVALFPGGFGTMDEGFEVLTLMQTGKARIIPVVLVDQPGGRYWETWFGFLGDYLLKQGLVSENDFDLFRITHDVDVAVAEILSFYKNFNSYRWVGSPHGDPHTAQIDRCRARGFKHKVCRCSANRQHRPVWSAPGGAEPARFARTAAPGVHTAPHQFRALEETDRRSESGWNGVGMRRDPTAYDWQERSRGCC